MEINKAQEKGEEHILTYSVTVNTKALSVRLKQKQTTPSDDEDNKLTNVCIEILNPESEESYLFGLNKYQKYEAKGVRYQPDNLPEGFKLLQEFGDWIKANMQTQNVTWQDLFTDPRSSFNKILQTP